MKKETKAKLMFLITTILMCIYLGWRIFFTLPIEEGLLQLIFGILLVYSESITSFTTFELFYRKVKSHDERLEIPDITQEMYPHIDVLIATHNESVELLYKTVNACTFMEYPDKSKVHIYLCDDGNRREVAQLAEQFQIGYLGMEENAHAKSGNLNHALSKTRSPLIATFDADMIPRSTFLMKTVPYFLLPKLKKTEDERWIERTPEEVDESFKIGFIQTPQSFYNPDLFQFNLYGENSIPNELDFFSREVNVIRNSSNGVAYTGSNTVIAREALEEIGGFPTDTITEDFETGILIQSKGYTTYSTEEPQAAGLAPDNIPSMISQRRRWARGVIQSCKNTSIPFTKGLTGGAKIGYFVGFLYWWSFFNRLIFILAPIMFALFDFRVVDCEFWELIIFWLPSYIFYSFSMRFLSSEIRNQRWCQVIDTIFMPYLILPVLLETIGIKQKKFKVTNKDKSQSSIRASMMYSIPYWILLTLSIIALIRFTYGKYGWALFYSSIIIFWILYNMVTLVYAIFFTMSRRAYRKTERLKARELVSIKFAGRQLNGYTIDLSEEGLAIELSRPEYIPDIEPVTFIIKNNQYTARFQGKVVYVKKTEGKWRYSVNITDINEENKRKYYQIIYNRNHSLPVKMDLWVTAFDDLVQNIKFRMKPHQPEKRTQPRIQLNIPITFTNGARGVVRNFNYKFIYLERFRGADHSTKQYVYIPTEGVEMVAVVEKRFDDRQEVLMRIVNDQELGLSQQFAQILNNWIQDKKVENPMENVIEEVS